MSRPYDLTRWNRAGLRKFEYINGSGPLYLEQLKEELIQSFYGKGQWSNLPSLIVQSEEEGLSEEQAQYQRNYELIDQYYKSNDDIGWNLAKVFAQVCHVLTGHIDAHANEAFLRTATQWENVRRLVELIDYHPAAATSASTRLVLIAKENRAGVVKKGFQVKYAPPAGGKKVIFETLEDVRIDHELNELRPKDWDKSDTPILPGGQPPTRTESYINNTSSAAANWPASYLQGIGRERLSNLNNLPGFKRFKIKDVLKLDMKSKTAGFLPIRILDYKSKAKAVCDFTLDDDWSTILDRKLPNLLTESIESLVKASGNTKEKVELLRSKIETLSMCLDHSVFNRATLRDFLPEKKETTETEIRAVDTPWLAIRKPKIMAGQIAMVYREYMDEDANKIKEEAEAVTIKMVDDRTSFIHLLPSSEHYTWHGWGKGEARLRVSPRWQRKCWLNGINVIRTVKPHGLSAGSYIAWKESDSWNYAEVTETDTRNMRLNYSGVSLPGQGTKLYELRPMNGDMVMADYEVIIILGGPTTDDMTNFVVKDVVPNLEEPSPEEPEEPIFWVRGQKEGGGGSGGGSGGGGGLLPPALLPDIGCFLFPSPMLPMDLVKSAVKMMLNLGVMQIPSTGEYVFKGMPFDGLLGPGEGSGEEELTRAATQLYKFLEEMTIQVECKQFNNQVILVWFGSDGMPIVDDNGNVKLCDQEGLTGDNKETCGLAKLTGIFEVDAMGNLLVNNSGFVIPCNGDDPPLPSKEITEIIVWGDDSESDRIEALKQLLSRADDTATIQFKKILDEAENEIRNQGPPLAKRKFSQPKATVGSKLPPFIFNGSSNKIEPGDWIVGEFNDGLQALKVTSLHEFDDRNSGQSYVIDFQTEINVSRELEKLYADFRGEIAAEGSSRNVDQVNPNNIKLDKIPPGLRVGRKVLLMSDGEGPDPISAKIKSVDGDTIVTDPPAEGFKKGNLVIRANVVDASHGTVKPIKRLSSGVTEEYSNSLLFDVANVSTVADSIFPSGVRADLEVKVDDLIWQQVPDLNKSEPTDSHYTVRATEEGFLRLIFGGRRLPTGTNNVSVSYRVGAGRAGNLDPGSLIKIVNPHPLVESIIQPTRSVGGEELEPVEFIRDKAPATLLALERSVSLVDFENLAMSRNDIWQAKAFYQPSAGTYLDRVRVVVVPAGGGEFDNSDPIRKSLEEFLNHDSVPTVSVRVASFKGIQVKLKIDIRVDLSSYEPIGVMERVRERILVHFALERRKINQPFYLSEVYQAVESTKGVADSSCTFQNNNNRENNISPVTKEQVLYLSSDPDHLLIDYQAYKP